MPQRISLNLRFGSKLSVPPTFGIGGSYGRIEKLGLGPASSGRSSGPKASSLDALRRPQRDASASSG